MLPKFIQNATNEGVNESKRIPLSRFHSISLNETTCNNVGFRNNNEKKKCE